MRDITQVACRWFQVDRGKSAFTQKFRKSYNDDIDKGCIFVADVSYLKHLQRIHCDFPILSDRMKIEKCQKLVCNMYQKGSYIVPIKALRLVLDYGLILKKVYGAIEFNQNAWLKSYIDINTKSKTSFKSDSEKGFF